MVGVVPAVTLLGESVRYESGVSTIMSGCNNVQVKAGHSPLGPGCGHFSDGVQVWRATGVVYVVHSGNYPKV